MAPVMFTQLRDDAEPSDRMIWRQVVRQMKPFVGQEEDHRRCGHEHRHVCRDVLFDDDGQRYHEREKNEDDGIRWHQDKPPLAAAFDGHVAISEDDVMVQLVTFVEHAKQRKAAVQDVLVRTPLEAERPKKRDRDRQQFLGSQHIRLKSNECRDEHAKTNGRGDCQVQRGAVTRWHLRDNLCATLRPQGLLVGAVHPYDDMFCKCRTQGICRGKPRISRVGLALVAFEEPSDGFSDFWNDRVDDHEADEEADESEFVGGGEGEHRAACGSIPLRSG